MRERKIRQRKQSFFWKIVRGLFLVFLFAGLFVIGTGIYSYADSRKRFLKQNQSQLETLTSTIIMQIYMAFGHGVAFFQEPESIIYQKPERERTRQDISEIWKVVELIRKSENSLSPLVINEFSFYKEDDNILAGAGTYDKEFFFSTICCYEDYSKDFWATHFTAPGRFVLPETVLIGKTGGKRVLPLVTIIKRFGSLAFYVSNVSVDYLDQIIMSSNAFLDEYYIFDGNQEIIMKSFESDRWKEAPVDLAGNMQKRKGVFTFKSEDIISGWTFYGLLTGENFLSVFRHILGVGGFLILVMFTGEAFLILFLSHNMYNPIKDMQSILPESSFHQKRDEIYCIKEGIRKLVDSDSKHLEKEKDFQLNSFHQSLILLFNGIPITERLKPIKCFLKEECHFSQSSYVCVSLMIQSDNSTHQNLNDILWNEILQKNISYVQGFLIIPLNRYLFEIIYSFDPCNQSLDDITDSLNSLQNSIQPIQKGIRISIGVGGPSKSLEQISCSHKQASMALPLLKNNSPFSIRIYNDLPANKKVSFTFYDQKGILNNIETGQKGLLESYLSTLVEKNEKQGIESDQMMELYRQILFVGRRVLEEHGKRTDDIALYGYIYKKLSEDPDILTLRLLSVNVINCLLTIQKECCGEANQNCSNRVDEIKHYIDEHYDEALSLVSIADYFCISAKYLSHIFKEDTNIKLSNYLGRVRMNKAKKLLANSNQRIGDIANLVGIDSHATFLRLFHKYEGLSPKEYRNLNLQKQEILYESIVS